MNLILFGFKGCGKSYFGKKLAEKEGYGFIDTDILVENLYEVLSGKKIAVRKIFMELTEGPFRRLENEVIQSLQTTSHSIIAVGGGTILDKANVEMLSSLGTMVYLEMNKEVLKKRLLEGELPAYINPVDPEGSFDTIYENRKAFYEGIAATRLDISSKKDSEVLTMLSEILHGKQ